MIIVFKRMTDTWIHGTDGIVGSLRDLLFDDQWHVRYAVVDTGSWLPGRRVLLSPGVFTSIDWVRPHLDVSLTQKQVQLSPDVKTEDPVSRETEIRLADYFSWQPYWGMGMVDTPLPAIDAIGPDHGREQVVEGNDASGGASSNLRSAIAVRTYHIEATDGELGHIDDYLIDDETWIVRNLVVETRFLTPGKHVVIPPSAVDDIRLGDEHVRIRMTRKAISESPDFDPTAPVNLRQEEHRYDVYGREHEPE